MSSTTIERTQPGGTARPAPIGRGHFLDAGVADLRDAIVRGEAARRTERRLRGLGVEIPPSLDLDALGSLVRVLERKDYRTVSQLGDAAGDAWARRIGVRGT